MKAFVSAVAAAILIAVVAALVLDRVDWSTANTVRSPTGNVRL